MKDRNRLFFRTPDEIEERAYAEQGFLHLGRVLTDAGLEAMRTESMAAWRAEKGEFDPAKTWLQNALLSDIGGDPVPMRAGEAIVFHCWMLHKSQGNFSPDRDRRILLVRGPHLPHCSGRHLAEGDVIVCL